MENRLRLPTLTELHFANQIVLDLNHKDTLLSGYFSASNSNQFHSLQLSIPVDNYYGPTMPALHDWATSHIQRLRSLRCRVPVGGGLSEWLRECSGTSEKLDIDFDTHRKV